jgi:PAS domain S-box-containing protein
VKKSTKPKKTKPRKADDLRERAEKLLLQDPLRIAHDNLPKLVHELQVHQIELDMQNLELREAQAKLEESRNRYYDMYDFAPVGYITMSTSGVIEESNIAAADMLATARSTLLGKLFQGFVLPDDLFLFLGHRESVLGRKKRATCEVRLKVQDRILFFRIESACALDGKRNPVSIRSALINVTETKAAEEELKLANERFAALAENARDIISRRDKDLRITYINSAVETQLGVPPKEYLGKTPEEMQVEVPVELLETFSKVLSSGKEGTIEFEQKTLKGSKVFQVNVIPEKNSDGEVESILSIGRDITHLRETQRDLEQQVRNRTEDLEAANRRLVAEVKKRESFEEMLRASATKMSEEAHKRRLLSARLVDLLEKDRRNVAMALHDQLGQSLATLKMQIETIAAGNDPGASREVLAGTTEKVSEIMALVRGISHELRPSALDTVGVAATLEALVAELKRSSDTEIIFFQGNVPKAVDKDQALSVYRIAQEALTNALKHSSAEHIFVNLIQSDGILCLTVEDDGKGFDQSAVEISPGGPLGIEIMKERATDAGGNLRIESHPGKGTQVMVEIPINMDVDEPKA